MEWLGISITVVVLLAICYVLFFHKETEIETLVQRYEKSGSILNQDLKDAEAKASADVSGIVSNVKTGIENADKNIDAKVANAVSEIEKKA
ncbi:MAG: hypothetical protein ACYDHF_07970 [Candidatus Cryosericum sp.]